MTLASWLTLFLGGGLVAALVALWKAGPERRKLNAETDTILDATVMRRNDDLRRALDQLLSCEEDRRVLRGQLELMTKRLDRAPSALIDETLADLNGMLTFWDGFTDAIIVSTNEDGGTIKWANKAFCDGLGRTCDDVVAIGWRGLVHPDDQRRTAAAETSAWDNPLFGFVNRMQHADGSWVTCRWYCKSYSHRGRTLARVEMGSAILIATQ